MTLRLDALLSRWLLPAAIALSGCGLGTMLRKNSDGGSYRQAIQDALDHDREYPAKEYGADSQWVGMLPASLDAGSGDERIRLRAKHDRGTTRLEFDGIKDGQICFRHPLIEQVQGFSEAEVARVDRIGRSYQFVVELAGPLTSPEVTKRTLQPLPEAVKLDQVEVVESEPYTANSGQRYLNLTQRRCAAMPPRPEHAAFLTVLVTPDQGVELSTDTYVLTWQLF